MYIYIYIIIYVYAYILKGSLQASRVLAEGPFWYSRQPTCIFQKVPGRTLFPRSAKDVDYFAAAPLVLTPIRGLLLKGGEITILYYTII